MQGDNAILGNIRKLCEAGQLKKALEAMDKVDQHGMHMPIGIFYNLLQACISSKDLVSGRKVHDFITKRGFGSNAFLGSHLIRMFAMYGSLLEANQVFSNLSELSVFTWHAMISAHTMLGQGEQALNLYCQMQQSSVNPGEHVFAAALKACSSISSLDHGMIIHAHIIENACESYAYIGSTLIDMYSKCGSLRNARRVFDRLLELDLVTWSAMISGYVHHECGHEALWLLQRMQKAGMEPDDVTFVSSLKACSDTKDLEYGKVIHGHIVRNGSEVDVYVGSTLVDMYNECGRVEDARKVFNRLPKRNVVTWSAMFAGYALHGPGEEALQLFRQMLQDGIEPNNVTCVSLLKACCSIAALDQGRLIHSLIIESAFELHVHIGSTLLDVYAKCGSLVDAQILFDELVEHNIVTWNALIAGYAQCGDYTSTLHYFKCMQQQGFKPNDVTFVCLLTSCSHLGLLKEACQGFRLLTEDLGCTLVDDHYNCMVDLFGRLGQMNEAEDMLKTIPFPSNFVGWSSLLSHCKRHGNVDLARHCFNQLVKMNAQYSSGYVIMNSIYMDAGMWEYASRVQELKGCAYAWKKPGKAFIEMGNKVHDFVVGDKSHPKSDEMLVKLRRLDAELKRVEYVPQLGLESQPLLGDDNGDAWCL